MPRYRHPRADDDTPGHPPARIHVSRSDKAAVDDDGTFEVSQAVAQSIADAHDVTVEDMAVTDTCEVVKADGDVCGRDKPCAYHAEEDA